MNKSILCKNVPIKSLLVDYNMKFILYWNPTEIFSEFKII